MLLATSILQQYWGFSAFRPLQGLIVESILASENDHVIILPTGGGKSICYQVPIMAAEGTGLVISPLISLMKDQVDALQKQGIAAEAIYSGMSFRYIDGILDQAACGKLKFLYVSPERLNTRQFLQFLPAISINYLVVDEAHCVSAWGHDFRPLYLKIDQFKDLHLKNVKVIACTASATPAVLEDVKKHLGLRSPKLFEDSLSRKNLSISVFKLENKLFKTLQILQNVPGSAIIYTKTRRKTKQTAEWLLENKIIAKAYHAGLQNTERFRVQDDWIKNKTRVIVATNAFGMGIDKGDVRVVVHLDPPDSLEAYYQEAGRAGRDGNKAYAVLLCAPGDASEAEEAHIKRFPPVEVVRKTYGQLVSYFQLAEGSFPSQAFDFDLNEFISTFGLQIAETVVCLKKIEDEGYILLNAAVHSPSKLMFVVDHRAVYDFQLRNPRADRVIKAMQRIYGGELYANYVKILETELAQATGFSVEDIIQILEFCSQQGVADYVLQKNKPQMVWLSAVHNWETLPINIEKRNRLLSADAQRIHSVYRFIDQDNVCRQNLIKAYFGQNVDEDCGICDNCLRKKREVSLDQVMANVFDLIKNAGPIAIYDLEKNISVVHHGMLKNALQVLIDQEKIIFEKNGVLVEKK